MFIAQAKYVSYLNLYGQFSNLLFELFCLLAMILSAEIQTTMLSDYITSAHAIYLHTFFHLEISLLTKISLCYCSFITE